MAGLDPATQGHAQLSFRCYSKSQTNSEFHKLSASRPWVAGSSPTMTEI
jgi:hypothetical protein